MLIKNSSSLHRTIHIRIQLRVRRGVMVCLSLKKWTPGYTTGIQYIILLLNFCCFYCAIVFSTPLFLLLQICCFYCTIVLLLHYFFYFFCKVILQKVIVFHAFSLYERHCRKRYDFIHFASSGEIIERFGRALDNRAANACLGQPLDNFIPNICSI